MVDRALALNWQTSDCFMVINGKPSIGLELASQQLVDK